MKMIIAMVAAGIALTAGAGVPAAAQSATPVCTAATAQATTIPSIIAAGDAMIGACVTVEAIRYNDRLYADNRARYLRERIYNDPSSSGGVIGLAGERDRGSPRLVRMTGRIDRCSAWTARREPVALLPRDMVNLGSFCDIHDGLMIDAVAGRWVRDATFVRLTRASAASGGAGDHSAALGNIEPLARGPVRERLATAGLAVVIALLERDLGIDRLAEARLRDLLALANGRTRTPSEITGIINRMANPQRSPFLQMVAGGRPQVEVFGWREPLWTTPESRAAIAATSAAVSEGLVCTSARADASSLWPIDERDADNHRDRPYSCVKVTIRSNGPAEIDVPQPSALHGYAREP